ncbi:hypothetical protein Poli38472_005643 [Pythium oligandrum]|uniref:B box-type domain-containing protein n=1 Tax=Pythium oligandrum TaxID=41045 RepID=A0A8K1CGX3_PYTOL|nr:hypothetical protein Poli38472_005643 [Pythium oligandrum]|eukprot:TMW63025.1 hypothetical protein Poli38472_005643 [Pythium oligandrum]
MAHVAPDDEQDTEQTTREQVKGERDQLKEDNDPKKDDVDVALVESEQDDVQQVTEAESSPEWIRANFAKHTLREWVKSGSYAQDNLIASIEDPTRCVSCEECAIRVACFSCSECAQQLCWRCADAIHIIPSLADHRIERSRSVPPISPPPEPTTVIHDLAPPSSVQSPQSPPSPTHTFPAAFAPCKVIEHRLHLPVGTTLFFRAEDCGRWAREVLHGTVVSADQSVRSELESADGFSYFYRVVWIRGVEALANGFFRANLVLPLSWWPIEIGVFPSQLAAFRATITAERLARHYGRRHRVSHDRRAPFPSEAMLEEILKETDTILGQEFRCRVTRTDDHAFVQALSHGTWSHNDWMEYIGRRDDLLEEAAAILEESEDEAALVWSPRTRLRFFLVEQKALLLPDVVRNEQVHSIVQQMLMVYVGFAWRQWQRFIKRHRRHERRQKQHAAACKLQHWARRLFDRRRKLLPGMDSIDALDRYRRRQIYAAKLYSWMIKQYEAKQRHALHCWAENAKVFDPDVRRRLQVPSQTTWHPSHGIVALPRLPRIPAHKRTDGSLAVEDLALFKQFRANHAGPTESSYWILRQRVLVGVYPTGRAFQDARRIVARADYTTSILLQSIGVFVCLADDSELTTFESTLFIPDTSVATTQDGPSRRISAETAAATKMPVTYSTPWKFERLVRTKHETLRVELQGAVRMAQRQLELGELERDGFVLTLPAGTSIDEDDVEADFALPPAMRIQRETLRNKLALAQQNVRKAEATLASLAPLTFHHFPIPKDGVPASTQDLETLFLTLEQHLRQQEKLYVFSMQGHGRTGLITALMLGRLYGIPANDALERAQRLHDCQYSMHSVPSTRLVSSPKTTEQIALVHQLLARYNDAIYAPVVLENTDDGFYAWRAQQRGIPIEKFTEKEGFMVGDRVDTDMQRQQEQQYQQKQRIAKRESAAVRLQYDRETQRREAETMRALDRDVSGS